VSVTIVPDDKSLDALAQHVKQTGHAFSMFDVTRLILAAGDRYHVRFACADERATGLFHTMADGGFFLSKDEALQHILRSGALEVYYRSEEIELEEPKGNYPSVAVCGFSGTLLAPPSHHSFQTALIRLHRERFSNMSLEDYKRRVRVESDPELVAKWKQQVSRGHRWVLIVPDGTEPAEGEEAPPPTTFSTRMEMESHFRTHFAEQSVMEVREGVIPGSVDKQQLAPALFIMLRQAVDTARKHLFDLSQKIGSSFERRGLKLFKRRAGKLFVNRVKPRAIDPGVIFSERVATIVEAIRRAPGIPILKLVKKISPDEAAPAADLAVAAPAAAEEVEAPATERVTDAIEGSEATAAPTAAPIRPARKPANEPVKLSNDQISVLRDIRWLANEGYVIEYSDGQIFLGVQGEATPAQPKPKKAKPAKSTEAKAEAGADTDATTDDASSDEVEEESTEADESVEAEANGSEEESSEADQSAEAPADAAIEEAVAPAEPEPEEAVEEEPAAQPPAEPEVIVEEPNSPESEPEAPAAEEEKAPEQP